MDGLEIYHAGDLNHWYWDGEDPQWNKNMTKAYREEIAKMHGRKADIAFLPLDRDSVNIFTWESMIS